MSKTITINPITRISGFMEIDVFIENHIVTDAQTRGLLFRGFEHMLQGRNPLDAIYFTQRICGICSSAHAAASSIALETAFGLVPDTQGRYLKDLIHGCEYLQNHIRHFYQFTIPDYVRLPEGFPIFQTDIQDFRLPDMENERLQQHYFESLEISRMAHQMLAVLGGKTPHNHGVFVGGVTAQATASTIIKMRSLLHQIQKFAVEVMMPDVQVIAHYYSDYFRIGKGKGNLITFGIFNNYKDLGTLYVEPQVAIDWMQQPLQPEKITEEIEYSWYQGERDTYQPLSEIPVADRSKPDAYTWIKAAKYQGVSCQGGPLARLWLSGEYRNGISTMDRTLARALEVVKVANILEVLLDHLIPDIDTQQKYEIPDTAVGAGLLDTTRGPLGHWLKIDQKLLSFYQVITPSVWNISSKGNDGQPGIAEAALIGTYVENEEQPVELGRIIRSFDPCVSCGTHIYTRNHPPKFIHINS